MSAGYPDALKMLVPDKIVFTNALTNPGTHYAIVIHKTGDVGVAPTAQQVASYFGNLSQNTEEKSVHYIVGKDGIIVQCVDENDGAGGNCCLENGYDTFWDNAPTKSNLNLCTYSIEHCSGTPGGDNWDIVTPQQAQASFRLIAYLCHKYGIAVDHIKGHNTLDPISKKNCPGNYPWNDLFSYLKGEGMTVPAGWKDNGTDTLVAPNGIAVRLGMRLHVLENTWDASNVPLETEIYLDSVLEESPSFTGSRQTFMDNELTWNKTDGVITNAHIGQELMYVRKDRDNCRTIIGELQQQINILKQGLPQVDINNVLNSVNKLASDIQSMIK